MITCKIREICGDYALDIGCVGGVTYTLYFNSRRNAETVKRCIDIDGGLPNNSTPVDFVEVVRCKNCKYHGQFSCTNPNIEHICEDNDYCSYGKLLSNSASNGDDT